MDRVLCVWVPDWPVRVAGAAPDAPLAVMAGGLVLACSPAARAAGVRRGMRLRPARARCPELRAVERDVEEEVRGFEPLVRALEEAVMPRLEVVRPGLLAAPVRGPARYWGGEPQLAERVTTVLRELGHPARAGAGDTVFTAALAARRGELVPPGESAAFLAPYPVGVLGRPRLTELLHRLGITTLGTFAALPADRVASRFGAEGVAAHRTARGMEARPVSSRTGTADHSATHVFEPATPLLEPVVFAAKAAAELLHQRLTSAGVVCARLEAEVELGDGRRLARVFRHEGRLSAAAVAERVRGVLRAWETDGTLATGGAPTGPGGTAPLPGFAPEPSPGRATGPDGTAGGVAGASAAGGAFTTSGVGPGPATVHWPAPGAGAPPVPGTPPGTSGTSGTPGVGSPPTLRAAAGASDGPGATSTPRTPRTSGVSAPTPPWIARPAARPDGGADGAGTGSAHDPGVVRLTLRPEGISPATGRQAALFGREPTPEEVERAAARVQALLGHRAVTRVELGGGRGPGDRVRHVPYGDAAPHRLPSGPWPGRLPAPHPASVYPAPLSVRLTDAAGRNVAVSARAELSGPPARLAVAGHRAARVAGWAGPWPVLEEWWDSVHARRMARLQVVTADGRAWLLAVERGQWWAEAGYG
ncbi:DNA polymerase Y family protein [Streptomyces spiramenti]|uniref:DNA polymerase Y family protein n=1 Tax=Streptomyces spiramenti TaxID=2720606 RepID=UPI001FD7841B|nr:DNA polymerase Y family protein [Streptomyces spiramenti]